MIDEVPFDVGEIVNVTIEKVKKINPDNPYPLRGTAYSYEDPFSSLFDPDDWKPFE